MAEITTPPAIELSLLLALSGAILLHRLLKLNIPVREVLKKEEGNVESYVGVKASSMTSINLGHKI